jgi:hypothetical protein
MTSEQAGTGESASRSWTYEDTTPELRIQPLSGNERASRVHFI